MNKKIFIGNWKMNKLKSEVSYFADNFLSKSLPEHDIRLAVPFLHINTCNELFQNKMRVGAQNCHWEDSGAYTGEVSPLMLKDAGADFVIIGHSERRLHQGDSNESCLRKIESALKNNLEVVLCVGEGKDQRENGTHEEFVSNQLNAIFQKSELIDTNKIIIAYEPIWSIGTGLIPETEQIAGMTHFIKSEIKSKEGIKVIYGGSVKPSNISEIMSVKELDGVLPGGASLDPEIFFKLISQI